MQKRRLLEAGLILRTFEKSYVEKLSSYNLILLTHLLIHRSDIRARVSLGFL